MNRAPPNNQRLPPPSSSSPQGVSGVVGWSGRGRAPFLRGGVSPGGRGGPPPPPPLHQQGMPPMVAPMNPRGGSGPPPPQVLPPPQLQQQQLLPPGFRGGGMAPQQPLPSLFMGGGRPPNGGRIPNMTAGRPGADRGGTFVGQSPGNRGVVVGGRRALVPGTRPPFQPGLEGRGGRMNFRGMPLLNHRFGGGGGRLGGLPLSHQQQMLSHPPPNNGIRPPLFRGGREPGRGLGPRPPHPPFPQSHVPRPPFTQPTVGTLASNLPPPSNVVGNLAVPQQQQQQLPQQQQPTQNPMIVQQPPSNRHAPIVRTMVQDGASAVTAPSGLAVERAWGEYTDPTTGNTYYSNGVTSQWTKPETMIQAERLSEDNKDDSEGDNADLEPARKVRKTLGDSQRIPEFATEEEALDTFNKLLADRDVTPGQKWSEVVKLFTTGSGGGGSGESVAVIWEGCQNALTTGERKQALAEYQTKLANDIRTKERQGRQRSKEAYLQLLSDVLPTVSSSNSNSGSASSSSNYLCFQDVQGILHKDERFHAIDDDATREALFVEFWEEYRKREERRKHNEKRDEQHAFIDVLKVLADSGVLTCASVVHNTTWDSFVASLDDSVRMKYSRYMVSSSQSDTSTATPSVTSLENHEKDFLFGRFIDEMQHTEDENRRRSQEDRRQAEIDQREFFLETLVRLAEEGRILPSSNFSGVVDSVLGQENSFVHLQQQDRDRPRELFEEFVNDWNEVYRGDRLFLSDIVRRAYEKQGKSIVVRSGTKSDESYEEFCQAILNEASNSANNSTHQRALRIISGHSPVSSARLYFNEMQQSRKSVQHQPQRGGADAESSEDEGEIAEEES